MTEAADIPLSPAAIEAFARGDRVALDRELGIRPWQVSPMDAYGPCPWPDTTAGAASWPMALRVRRALEAAVKARKVRH